MCGVAGLLSTKTKHLSEREDYSHVEKMLADQAYRGPDHHQIECVNTPNLFLTLGHNRLKIIDLNVNSNQPMWEDEKRYIISYNGMLYNYLELRQQLKSAGYQFTTQGDTEVVLKSFMHWGHDAFQRFNGMFAVAIFDVLEEKLYLIRDRYGIKPLFYFYQRDKVYFASTSSKIAELLHLQPNMAYHAKGLAYWCYDFESESAYKDLLMVAPSEIVTVNFKNELHIKTQKYYCLSEKVQQLIDVQLSESHQTITAKIQFLLEDAVALRLQSDVPVGLSLSGGIDSGTVAGLAKKNADFLPTFSFGSLNDRHSEALNTKMTADKVGCNVHFVNPSANEMRDSFWRTLQLQDAPYPNFSIPAQHLVFDHARQQGIKVMLGGQGGDEIFMGYRKYLLFYLSQLLYTKKSLSTITFMAQLIPSLVGELHNFKNNLFSFKRYTNNLVDPVWKAFTPTLDITIDKRKSLWQRQLADIQMFSLPTLLRYEDRNSMGNGIESRLPFLDYRLVELALALPDTLKLHRGYTKWILRKISQQYIPSDIAFSRQKRGFDVKSQNWIASGIGEDLRATLHSNPHLLKRMGISNKVNILFSNQKLITDSYRLAEAITLAWLAKKNHFVWG
ncbi:MAG: asparagine synthase (glutamine-hydrolyzing) [Gammaproteobacteria bacterium]|nr:asparagine synthase (glutamine-hydrolyzing) [Gammaproteobacteria bacterium]